jgi:hypothetical protein
LGVVLADPVGEAGVKEKKLLPCFGAGAPEAEAPAEKAEACSDACCSDAAHEAKWLTPETREANPEAPEGGLQRTVAASRGWTARAARATVEKARRAGFRVRRAVRELRRGQARRRARPRPRLPEDPSRP